MHKKLTRSRDHRMISGVLGGLGKYFTIDPVIPRILFVVFVIGTGIFPGIIGYIIAAYFIPEDAVIASASPITDDDSAI